MSDDFIYSSATIPDFRPLGNVSTPEGILPLLAPIRNRAQEHLVVVTVGARMAAISIHTVSIGIADTSLLHPREVFRPAILDNAVGVILAHNHPSGDPTPSEADIEVTRLVAQAGAMLGIHVLDHLVVSLEGFVSLKELQPGLFHSQSPDDEREGSTAPYIVGHGRCRTAKAVAMQQALD